MKLKLSCEYPEKKVGNIMIKDHKEANSMNAAYLVCFEEVLKLMECINSLKRERLISTKKTERTKIPAGRSRL